MQMTVNVLIPAKNEQAHIESTLGVFADRDHLAHVHVLVNGSTDQTADIARSFPDVEVTELEASGKFAAMQHAMRELGDRAMDGFVVLDADTAPLSAEHWSRMHESKLAEMEAGTYNGNLLFDFNAGVFSGFIRNGLKSGKIVLQRLGRDTKHIYGTNLAIKPTEHTRDLMLTAPNVWPQEDNMIIDIHERYTNTEHMVSMDPRLFALSSARGFVPITNRLRVGRDAAMDTYEERYKRLAPDGSVDYRDVKEAVLDGDFLEAARLTGDYPEE